MTKGGDTEVGKLLGTGSLFRGISAYPKCAIFECKRYHGGTVNNRCCFYCDKKDQCGDPCLNDPERCGKCVMPPEKEGDPPCGT